MRFPPKIMIALDLSDGQAPIQCNDIVEAEFFADIWRASQGDAEAMDRLKAKPSPRPKLLAEQ
jgi:hypothetical protein